MALKPCRECGKQYKKERGHLYCSPECKKEYLKKYYTEYNNRLDIKKARKWVIQLRNIKKKRLCKICGGPVTGHGQKIYCSEKCKKEKDRRRNKQLRLKPHAKKIRRAYLKRPDVRKRIKKYGNEKVLSLNLGREPFLRAVTDLLPIISHTDLRNILDNFKKSDEEKK